MKQRNVIGRSAVVRVNGAQYVGTVIDARDNHAKRIRIQTPGPKQGSVVLPGEYILVEFED